MLNDEDFTDVTLACDDGQLVKAHKVILAAASPLLQENLGPGSTSQPTDPHSGDRGLPLEVDSAFHLLGQGHN